MEVATLNVENRIEQGTNKVRNLRDTGKIPMVLYGGGDEPLSLKADYVAVKRHLEHRLRVYKLHIGDVEQSSYLQSVQWDCLTDEPLHLDFRRIDMDKPLKLEVEMVLLGHPKGVTAGGGLVRDLHALPLQCMPAAVPEQIEIRIAHLDRGEKILASDLELPEGCALDMPGDTVVLHISMEEQVTFEPEPQAEAEGGGPGAAEGAGPDSE